MGNGRDLELEINSPLISPRDLEGCLVLLMYTILINLVLYILIVHGNSTWRDNTLEW